jgi:hypothetical protein
MASLSFDQIAALKPGQVFYECEGGLNIEARVETAPEVLADSDGKRSAVWMAVNTKSGHRISYRVTEGLMHYGPRIYDEPEYHTIKDGEAVVLFVGE